MTKPAPIVYLLHGDDEFAIAQHIVVMQKKAGDPSLVEANTTHLDGRTFDLEGWFSAACTVPFLAKRRLVILTNPKARLSDSPARKKFTDQLDRLPASTALVIVENKLLGVDKHPDWLLQWARQAGERVLVHAYPLPKDAAMEHWIMERAKTLGGQFTPAAAKQLAVLIDNDPRLADQEIQKALTYTNFKRAVEADDVELLTPDSAEGSIFDLVDLLAAQDGRKALSMLKRLLDEQDPISIFSMIVRQFRFLLLTREIYESGGGEQQAVEQLAAFKGQKMSPYPVKKAYRQAQRFSIPFLEDVYQRLLALDEAIKTSQMPGELALEVFVASFTNQADPARH
jgi:DNA polymerase-3 subunit delta